MTRETLTAEGNAKSLMRLFQCWQVATCQQLEAKKLESLRFQALNETMLLNKLEETNSGLREI